MHPSCTLPNTQKWVEKGTFAPIPCTLHTPCLTLFVLRMFHVSWSTVAPYSPCVVDLVLLTLISPSILDRTIEKGVPCYIIVHIVDMCTTSFVVVVSYYTSKKIMQYWRMNHYTCLVVGELCMFKWLPCFALFRRKSGNACCNHFFLQKNSGHALPWGSSSSHALN